MDRNELLRHVLDPNNAIDVRVFGYTACNAAWGTGTRSIPEDLIYVTDGGAFLGQLHVNGKATRIRFESGCALWLPAGSVHSFSTIKDVEPPTVYHLRFKHQGLLNKLIMTYRSDHIAAIMRLLFDDYHSAMPDRDMRFRSRLCILLSEFMRADQDSGENTLKPGQRLAIMEVINQSAPSDRPQPSDLAEAAGLSNDWFSRVFHRTYGCSPRSWLKRRRIQRAAERLAESNASISEIAEEFGYEELFRFSRQFREVMQCSPRQWRQRHHPSRKL